MSLIVMIVSISGCTAAPNSSEKLLRKYWRPDITQLLAYNGLARGKYSQRESFALSFHVCTVPREVVHDVISKSCARPAYFAMLSAVLVEQGCRDRTTKEQRNMVHLWQYSGNAGIATCSKPLDAATCISRFLHTCSECVKC